MYFLAHKSGSWVGGQGFCFVLWFGFISGPHESHSRSTGYLGNALPMTNGRCSKRRNVQCLPRPLLTSDTVISSHIPFPSKSYRQTHRNEMGECILPMMDEGKGGEGRSPEKKGPRGLSFQNM